MDTIAAAGLGVALILILFVIRWKIRVAMKPVVQPPPDRGGESASLLCQSGHLVHRLCPHNNVVQGFDVDQKDSLDDHLDILARKLADKESRLRLSKCKIRETQNEIQNLHAIDNKVRTRYREIMDSLRTDLLSNEKECRKLQEQIEWVSRRRAELKEEASGYGLNQNIGLNQNFGLNQNLGLPDGEAMTMRERERRHLQEIAPLTYSKMLGETMVRRGQRLYGEAAAELASNLAELQRGRTPERVTEKTIPSTPYQRHRKEPHLPSTMSPLVIKSPPKSPNPEMERNASLLGYHTPMT